MASFDEYHKIFTTESDEEINLGLEIDRENQRFEDLPSTKEHREKVRSLYEERHKIFSDRIEKAQKMRKEIRLKSKVNFSPSAKPKLERSKELNEAVDTIKKLSEADKRVVARECFSERIPDGKEMLDGEVLGELHDILMQTTIEFIREKGLKNIWGVSFGADGLQESAEIGTWCPGSDSFLGVEGLEDETYTTDDGEEKTIPSRVNLGESY